MKKALTILTLCLALSTQAWAINCDKGQIITAKDGREFCASDVKMTWWSAFSWCESHGLKMASIKDCDYQDQKYYVGSPCFNFQDLDTKKVGSRSFWASTIYDRYSAKTINTNGTTYSSYKDSAGSYHALCK